MSQHDRDTFQAVGNYALVGAACCGFSLLVPPFVVAALVVYGLIWFLAYGGRQGWGGED